MARSRLLHVAVGALVVLAAGAAGHIGTILHRPARHGGENGAAPSRPAATLVSEPSGKNGATLWNLKPPPAPARLLVKFREPYANAITLNGDGTIGRFITDLGLPASSLDERFPEVPGLFRATFPTVAGRQMALQKLRADPRVEYAEADMSWHVDSAPSDPEYSAQWGLENTGQAVNGHAPGTPGVDVEAPAAWESSHGSEDVIVAVIDSGVDYEHEDLAANMWTNLDEIPNNKIDDDGNGFVDDVHGMNAIDDSGDPMDDAGHGTHVAGIIGAVGDNNTGVVGVNWTARVMALKFLSAFGGGTTSDAIRCFDYAIAMRERGENVRVINCSWGGGEKSLALRDAIDRAGEAGILVVCAAGNESLDSDARPHFPSCYDAPNVLSVAAFGPDGGLAGFSNFGRETVDIAAPGVDVLSTLPGNQYGFASGTSMAAPFVSGTAALALASDTRLPFAKLGARLLTSSFALPGHDGKTATGGRLSAKGAVAAR